jgi:pyruvate/2-oxoglutarate dehydrogenase complex dihydrolipoamide acyltransferase (E2) component
VIAQIETDKVTMDVKYTDKLPGTVSALFVKEQDEVKVGQIVAKVTQGEATAAPAPAPAQSPAAAAPPKAAAAAPPPAAKAPVEPAKVQSCF